VKRPRVVDRDGREVPLDAWSKLASADPLGQRALEQMAIGVATRKYARTLGALDVCAVFIDGIHFGEHVVLCALGVDATGAKHVLGLWEGATENEVACKSMLENFVERGLASNRSRLFIIDGSKGLRAAIRSVFGKRTLARRCVKHTSVRRSTLRRAS